MDPGTGAVPEKGPQVTGRVVVAVRGLRFRYSGAEVPALRDIGFDLAAGEVLGVLGPNGSGKSTLLSALLDTRKGERDGEVRLFPDEPVRDPRRLIGYMTQCTGLYSSLTCRENLTHAARLVLPPRTVGDAVRTAVAEYRLEPVADRRVGELSGGWRQLCHLATSFVHDPPVRLLDEPTNALDFETRQHLVALMRGWAERGVACVVTSHYPEDLEQMCTRLVIIRGGVTVRSAWLADLVGHLRRRLLLDLDTPAGPRMVAVPLPPDLADMARAIAGEAARNPGATVTRVRVGSGTLRELLEEDPELAGVVVDE